MGVDPMSKQRDHQNIAGVTSVRAGAGKPRLHAVDRLDYLIRHWLTPVSLEKGFRSLPRKNAWVPSSGLSTDIQDAIGRGLRAQYTVDRSMPARLAYLLKEFEKRSSNDNEPIARDHFASAT